MILKHKVSFRTSVTILGVLVLLALTGSVVYFLKQSNTSLKSEPLPTLTLDPVEKTTNTAIPPDVPQVDSGTTAGKQLSKPKVNPGNITKIEPKPECASITQSLANINGSIQKFNIVATLDPAQHQYTYSTWSALDEQDACSLATFSTYLQGEFSKFPVSLVVNSGLKKIGLIKNLTVSGQVRSSVPIPITNSVIYSVVQLYGSGSNYARQVISHEYWHYLDYAIMGSYTYLDGAWTACNPPGFAYGAGGSSAYGNPNYSSAFHPQTGFITQYALYAIEEDRAELFSWLIFDSPTVTSLYPADEKLKCKADRLVQIIQQLSPGFSF